MAHVAELEPQLAIVYARVSSQGQAEHLKYQKADVRKFLKELGFTVVVSSSDIAPGWENGRPGLRRAILKAKSIKAIVVAESANRFWRNKSNRDAPLTFDDLQKLAAEAGGVQLATVKHPDASPSEVHSQQTKRGQGGRGNYGGRPRQRTPKKARRQRLGREVTKLRRKGLSYRRIATRLKVPLATVYTWLKMERLSMGE
jgi:DNA invertase Pin-like site-specific DNA recombinase